jgi:hypothetical protein
MAKKKQKHKPKHPMPRLRNASGGAGKMQKLGDTIVEAVERTAASAAGGAAASLIGGFAVTNDLMDPETIGLITTVGGAALASRSSTKWREAFNGAAAAGAGQLVLGYMAKRALKSQAKTADKQPPNGAHAPVARQGMNDAHVMQMFRDAVGGLDAYYDERARRDEERMRYVDPLPPDFVVMPAA